MNRRAGQCHFHPKLSLPFQRKSHAILAKQYKASFRRNSGAFMNSAYPFYRDVNVYKQKTLNNNLINSQYAMMSLH